MFGVFEMGNEASAHDLLFLTRNNKQQPTSNKGQQATKKK
jgi:hypothetical protein